MSGRRLYLGHLPPDADRAEVEKLFLSVSDRAKIVDVRINNGYGFIEVRTWQLCLHWARLSFDSMTTFRTLRMPSATLMAVTLWVSAFKSSSPRLHVLSTLLGALPVLRTGPAPLTLTSAALALRLATPATA
jgi:hypothetical protein